MYVAQGTRSYSVTGLIGLCFPPYLTPKVRGEKNVEDEDEALLSESSKHGVKMHRDIDAYIKHRLEPEVLYCEFNMFKLFMESMASKHPELVEISSEVGVYSPEHRIGGRVDCIIHNTHSCVIIDWKRCSDQVINNEYQPNYVRPPLGEYTNCKYSRWCVQLNMYRQLVEQTLGLKVLGLIVVVMYANNGTYKTLDIPFKHIEMNKLVELADSKT